MAPRPFIFGLRILKENYEVILLVEQCKKHFACNRVNSYELLSFTFCLFHFRELQSDNFDCQHKFQKGNEWINKNNKLDITAQIIFGKHLTHFNSKAI